MLFLVGGEADLLFNITGGFTSFLALAPSFCVGNSQQRCLPLVGCLRSNSCDIMGTTVTEVLPFLYLGCHRDAQDWEIIQSHNIKYVMNVTDKCESRFEERVKFLRLPVRDAGDENILIHFDQAIAFIGMSFFSSNLSDVCPKSTFKITTFLLINMCK